MNKLKYINIIFYIVSSILILMSIYYLYLSISDSRRVVIQNQKKIDLFLANQTKNRNGIQENFLLLQKIDKELNER